MLGVSADARANFAAALAAGRHGRRRSNREEFSMRFMKTAMAIAAVGIATLSVTMVAKRKRQGQGRKVRKSRA
jgi:hypothetical protein